MLWEMLIKFLDRGFHQLHFTHQTRVFQEMPVDVSSRVVWASYTHQEKELKSKRRKYPSLRLKTCLILTFWTACLAQAHLSGYPSHKAVAPMWATS